MLGYNRLLTETCSYERCTGVNKYNEKTYATPTTLVCFTSFDIGNIRSITSQEVTLNKKIYINNDFEPEPFDKFDSMEVKKIIPIKGLKQATLGWEVWV